MFADNTGVRKPGGLIKHSTYRYFSPCTVQMWRIKGPAPHCSSVLYDIRIELQIKNLHAVLNATTAKELEAIDSSFGTCHELLAIVREY